METKFCRTCSTEKPVEEFNKNTTRDGYQSRCRECQRKYYKEHRDVILKNVKENSEKHQDRIINYRKNYYEQNKEDLKEKYKIYNKNNPERMREYRAKNAERISNWRKDYRKSPQGKITVARHLHKRRCLSKQTPCTLTLLQWEKILKSQNNRCAICGKRFCKSRKPEKDHIIPLSKGGGLTFENVQALCKHCNISKNAKLDHTKIITWSHNGITT